VDIGDNIVTTLTPIMGPAPPDSAVTRRLIDARAVGARTGMSWRTVYRYADMGLMPFGLKVGSLRRWDADEIESWISGGCRPVRQAGGKR
jgi:predicted DNA-binding transcriptional regulator AlpA